MYNFFKTKIRYEKMNDNGIIKPTTEEYLVDALSFSEAEARIIDEMTPFVTGVSVSSIDRYKLSDVFLNGTGDKYYRARLEFISLDEKSGREKKTPVFMLVQADNIDEAKETITSEMKRTTIDYNISKIEETKIFDIFIYKTQE